MADNKVSHEFGRQLIKWHDRFISVKETCHPHFGVTVLTEKFYARHDALSGTESEKPKVCKYMKEVGMRQIYGPRELNDAPMTENQMYGWLADKAFVYPDENDRDLYCRGRKVDPMTKIQLLVSVGLKRDRLR